MGLRVLSQLYREDTSKVCSDYAPLWKEGSFDKISEEVSGLDYFGA